MTITAEERAAIDAYTGPVHVIEPRVSGLLYPVWDGERLVSGEDYKAKHRRIQTRNIAAVKARQRKASQDLNDGVREATPQIFRVHDIAKVRECSTDTAKAYVKRGMKAGRIRLIRMEPNPFNKLSRRGVYEWV